MRRKRWLWVAVLILVGVLLLLHGVVQANGSTRSSREQNVIGWQQRTPIWDASLATKAENEIASLQIAPSIGRLESTTFYMMGFGFAPNETITCKHILPNGSEIELDANSASHSGSLFFPFKIAGAGVDESAAGINHLTCRGRRSGLEKSAHVDLLMDLTP